MWAFSQMARLIILTAAARLCHLNINHYGVFAETADVGYLAFYKKSLFAEEDICFVIENSETKQSCKANTRTKIKANKQLEDYFLSVTSITKKITS